MPSAQSLRNMNRLRAQGAASPKIVPTLPPLPDDVMKRFPSMREWKQQADRKYRDDFATALGWPINPGA